MECDNIKENLVGYLDGKLDKNTSEEILKHLSICTECSKELEQLKRSWELLGEYEPISVPQDFSRKILARAETESAYEFQPLFSTWTPYIAAAAVFLLAVSGTLVYFSYHPLPAEQLSYMENFVIDEMGIIDDDEPDILDLDTPDETDVIDDLILSDISDEGLEELTK